MLQKRKNRAALEQSLAGQQESALRVHGSAWSASAKSAHVSQDHTRYRRLESHTHEVSSASPGSISSGGDTGIICWKLKSLRGVRGSQVMNDREIEGIRRTQCQCSYHELIACNRDAQSSMTAAPPMLVAPCSMLHAPCSMLCNAYTLEMVPPEMCTFYT